MANTPPRAQVFVYALAEWATPTNHVNQAMVWSRIVQQPRAARMKEVVRIEYPYALTDQGANCALPLPKPCPACQPCFWHLCVSTLHP